MMRADLENYVWWILAELGISLAWSSALAPKYLGCRNSLMLKNRRATVHARRGHRSFVYIRLTKLLNLFAKQMNFKIESRNKDICEGCVWKKLEEMFCEFFSKTSKKMHELFIMLELPTNWLSKENTVPNFVEISSQFVNILKKVEDLIWFFLGDMVRGTKRNAQ